MTGCRIGKIKLRNGAEVRVLETWPKQTAEYCRAEFERCALNTLKAEPAMVGFFMMAWSAYGHGRGATTTDHMMVMEGSPRAYSEIPDFARAVAIQRVAERRPMTSFDPEEVS